MRKGDMRQRGRPLGEVSKIVLQALAEQPRSTHQLARDLQASTRLMVVVVSKLKLAGRIEVVDIARNSRSSRPVAVLGVVEREMQQDRSSAPPWMR